jgi:Flp pilus assembly pilin Flp
MPVRPLLLSGVVLQSGARELHGMSALIAQFKTRSRQDEGQDLLEYALLVALIALGAIGAVQTVGQTVSGVFWDAIAQLL